jgi:hypothetical protein
MRIKRQRRDGAARLAAVAVVLALNVPVKGWDAGPRACRFNECSGGASQGSFSTSTWNAAKGIREYGPTQSMMWRGNTHLWVVNRAVDLLSASRLANARAIARAMRSGACAGSEQLDSGWMAGLWDADDTGLNELSKPGSHFYNDTADNGRGRDFFGNPTSIVAYDGGPAVLPAIAIALTNNNAFNASKFRMGYVADLRDTESCYNLGILLHYVTDLTQPMHSSSFSALQSPKMLHPAWENYVPVIQGQVVAPSSWDERMYGYPVLTIMHSISENSNTRFATRLSGILANQSQPSNCRYETTEVTFDGLCWRPAASLGNSLNALTAEILNNAAQDTASFIYAFVSGAYDGTRDSLGYVTMMTGAKVGSSVQDRFAFGLDKRIMVVNSSGEVWAHDLSDTNVPAPYRLTGAPVARYDYDKYAFPLGNRIIVVNQYGETYAHSVSGNVVSPPVRLAGPLIGNASDDTAVIPVESASSGTALLVTKKSGDVYWYPVTDSALGAATRLQQLSNLTYSGNVLFGASFADGVPQLFSAPTDAYFPSLKAQAVSNWYQSLGPANPLPGSTLAAEPRAGQHIQEWLSWQRIKFAFALGGNLFVIDNQGRVAKQAFNIGKRPQDGDVLRDPATGAISFIYRGQRKWIPDPTTFFALGFTSNDHHDDPAVNQLPAGGIYPHLEMGQLPRNPVTGATYLVEKGYRRWIPDPTTFANLGLSWGNTVDLPAASLDVIPEGPQARAK